MAEEPGEVFALPARLVRRELGDLRDRLIRLVDAARFPIRLDAANVIEVDGPGVQLLLSLRKSVEHRGGWMLLEGSSPEIEKTLRAYRCADWLLG